ncbi:MAG: hypothetical protein ACYSUK_00070 [Planctomycetota bacterium]|jgi:hypothetical protein
MASLINMQVAADVAAHSLDHRIAWKTVYPEDTRVGGHCVRCGAMIWCNNEGVFGRAIEISCLSIDTEFFNES